MVYIFCILIFLWKSEVLSLGKSVPIAKTLCIRHFLLMYIRVAGLEVNHFIDVSQKIEKDTRILPIFQ